MKNVGLILIMALATVSCSDNNIDEENSEIEKIELGESYGPVGVNVEDAVSVDNMLSSFEGETERTEYTFEADLDEVCSKAGCWVNIEKSNGETFMVRFKDHFTIPPETEIGTGAFFHGVAFWDTISVEMLQHFAEDAGDDAIEIAKITEPKFELGFIADGITLKK